jgi:hypothetical protein
MTLDEWFDMKGKRFLELKLKGGWKLIKDPDSDSHGLNAREVVEFCRLVGQLDGLIWMLMPSQPEERQRFDEEAKRFFKDREREYKVTRNLPRGRA